MSRPRRTEERVLVYAPFGRDAVLTHQILRDHDVLATRCDGVEELVAGIEGGAAVVMVTEEALDGEAIERIVDTLAAQEPWSDLPFIVFAREESRRGITDRIGNRFDVTVVERPVRIATLISVVRAALRARRRQYEVRSLLLQLEETDRRKDEFLAMLGHELRNPLASVQTAVDLLREPELDQDTLKRARQVIARQASNLGRIVDDLLEVSRVTRGKIELRTKPCDLGVLLSDCVESLREDAEARGHRLRLLLPESPPWTHCDPVRFEQIFTNLISNAIKYTPDGGKIEVAVEERSDDEVAVRVSDDGIGIDPEMLPRVFDAFTQAHPSVDRSSGGLGLGLPVVKTLVRLHGGTVRVDSEGPDHGSTFTVTLPRLDPDDARISEPETNPEPAQEPARNVLLLDDDEDIALLMSGMLRRWGYDVRTASNGREGLDAIADTMPDVALVDIGMPVMDGYAFARAVLEQHGRRAPRLIAMTGYGQPEDRRRATEAGFAHHLTKPVEASTLRRVLSEPASD